MGPRTAPTALQLGDNEKRKKTIVSAHAIVREYLLACASQRERVWAAFVRRNATSVALDRDSFPPEWRAATL